MSAEVLVDGACSFGRICKFYDLWRNTNHGNDIGALIQENNALHSADAIIIARGQMEDDYAYSKTMAMQIWLFGYEIQNVLIVLCQDTVIIYTDLKNINKLKKMNYEKNRKENSPKNFSFLVRNNNDDERQFADIIEQIKRSNEGKTLGVFMKDEIEGDFGENWKNALNQHSFTNIDISSAIGYLLSVKDAKELTLIRKACEITGKIYSKSLRYEIINIIDSERIVKHSKLSERVESALSDEKFVSITDRNYVEMCYPALIQSGGNYNLKFSAAIDKNVLHYGNSSIVCALGVRYRFYCSNLVRTLLVTPSDEIKNTYIFLLECEELIINELKHNVQLCHVFKLVQDKIKSERPELVNKMTNNLGTTIGIEFRESSVSITNKCTVQAKKGMTFQISIGFNELNNSEAKDDKSKVYALFIGDTVVVNEDQPCTVVTSAKKEFGHNAITIQADSGENKEEEEMPSVPVRRTAGAVKSRGDVTTTNQESLQDHQHALLIQLNERAKARLTSTNDNASSEKVRKVCNSYKSEGQLPQDPNIQELKLHVDKRYETVILPIYGVPTPFHISVIKNVSKVRGDGYYYLRINFFIPGVVAKQTDSIDKENVYIKELTYRSPIDNKENNSGSDHLSIVYESILEVQKKFKDQEQQRKQMEGVVKQPSLILNTNKTNPKLKDLYIRPSLANKRINGTLEAHTNGFRYTSVRGDKIDIIYSNVAHAFYQTCDNEMIILIHFHLKNAIIFGKRKQIDIQFYTEVGELTTDLGKHRNMHDRDDMYAEKAERELRNKLKAAFQGFIDKVVQQKHFPFTFEQPFRGLSFHGTPYRSMVLISPTTSCVVQLTEWPPLVIILDDVEIVHFERVHFQLKNFDMVFIMKDYSKKTCSIQSIPMTELDPIKKWLNSCDICFTEGPQSLNWTKIMKTITDDLLGFFDNGGWTFLETNGDEKQDEGGNDDSEIDEDDYNPSEDESAEEGSESEYSGEEDEEEFQEEDDDESDVSEDLPSDEESGKSWSELEEEARKADAEKMDYDSDNGGRHKKKGATKSFETKKRQAQSSVSSDNKNVKRKK